jgi:hypothetical protein
LVFASNAEICIRILHYWELSKDIPEVNESKKNRMEYTFKNTLRLVILVYLA